MPEVNLADFNDGQLIDNLLGRPTFHGVLLSVDLAADPSRQDQFTLRQSETLERRRLSHLLHAAADRIDNGG
jgi:hypothetical protein